MRVLSNEISKLRHEVKQLRGKFIYYCNKIYKSTTHFKIILFFSLSYITLYSSTVYFKRKMERERQKSFSKEIRKEISNILL